MQHPPPNPPCEVDQAIGYLEYSRFVIAAELHGNIRFVKDPQKLSIGTGVLIYHRCEYEGCPAGFKFIKNFDNYIFKSANLTHIHSGPPPQHKNTPTSGTYRAWIKKFLMNHGSPLNATQEVNKTLEIPKDHTCIHMTMKQTAINQLKYYLQQKDLMRSLPDISLNQFQSLQNYVNQWEDQHDDLIYFDIQGEDTDFPDKLVFIYSDNDMISQIHEKPPIYHLDSTFKLIIHGFPFYVLATKFANTHSIPLCYFIIYPDNSENISFCLSKYFETTHTEPEFIMSDCALNIFNGIRNSFPECNIFWCALHVIRALKKNLSKINDEEIRSEVEKFMNILCYYRDCTEEDAAKMYKEHIIDKIQDQLEFNQYFTRQWDIHKQQWIAAARPNELTVVNNVSESLFKKIKYHDFGCVKNQRIDVFVKNLLEEVAPNYFYRIKNDLLQTGFIPSIRIREPRLTDYKTKLKREVQSRLYQVLNFVQNQEANLNPLRFLLENAEEKLSQINEKIQNSITYLRSFEIPNELLDTYMLEINEFCYNSPDYILEHFEEFLEDFKEKNNLID